MHKIQKFIFLIRNAEVCGDGECIWKAKSDPWYQYGSYEYWGGLGGSYEYEDDSYNNPRKTRNKRSAGYE